MKKTKSILITGASSGIGAALAKIYAEDGAHLFLQGRNKERLELCADECRKAGAIVDAQIIDVTQQPEMENWIHKADDAAPLDLVIANAGISKGTSADGNFASTTQNVFDVNVAGVWHTIHPAVSRMRPRRRGQIAIMSSIAGFRGLPTAAAYSASKMAVRGYGEALRGLLHADNIGVSVICPGYVRSPMTDKNKFPMPFIMDAERAAHIIRKGLANNKGRIAFPFPMYAVVWLLGALPPALTDPFLRKLPSKKE